MIFNFDIRDRFFIEDESAYVFHKLQEEIAASQWHVDHRGFAVNDDIYILPMASPWQPGSGHSIILYLDTMNAFGDGRHPTTFMCLNALHRLLSGNSYPGVDSVRMLDIGTGTGILSILACKMGVSAITALDLFPESVENARANASLNGCNTIEFHVSDIALFRQKSQDQRQLADYDLITANLLPPVILENMDRMVSLLAAGGTMILSGVSELRAAGIESLFAPRSLSIMEHLARERWHCYILRRAM